MAGAVPPYRVKEYEYELGQYAFAGQYQQSPVPRKGGIFKREYWQPYVPPATGSNKGKWPDFDFIVVSVDSAFTEKEENDPIGCTIWGVWTHPKNGYPKVMLVMAWRKHLPIHGEDQEPQERGENDNDYVARCMPHWGLCEMIAWNCRRFGGADVLLVEAKANGRSSRCSGFMGTRNGAWCRSTRRPTRWPGRCRASRPSPSTSSTLRLRTHGPGRDGYFRTVVRSLTELGCDGVSWA